VRSAEFDATIALFSVARRDRPLAAFLSAPAGPEQDCQNDRPNDAPADPRDVWVSRLPFENRLMDGHYCNALPRRVPLEPPLSRSDTSPGYDFVNSELDESIGRTAPMRHIVDKSVSRAAKCEKSKGTKSLAPKRD
jgi:hypothetical protein